MSQEASLSIGRLKPLVRAAIKKGNLALVSNYLDRGGELHARDQSGLNPLMIAALSGHFDLCRLLLDRGADTSPVDASGQTASDIARAEGHQAIVALIEAHGSTQVPIERLEMPDGLTSELLGDWLPEDEIRAPVAGDGNLIPIPEPKPPLASHRLVSKEADWGDLEVDLPDRERLQIERETRRPEFQEKLTALIGESRRRGAFRVSIVESISRDFEGTDDGEIRRHLIQMLGEIGAIAEEDEDEWGHGYPSEERWNTDEEYEDCILYLNDLRAQTNDPYSLHRTDVERSVLLDRESEGRIGRLISVAIKDACRAIASDPRTSTTLAIIQSELGADPTLGGKLSRIEEDTDTVPDRDTGDDTEDSDARAGPASGKFSLLVGNAIQILRAGGSSTNNDDVRLAIESLELTVFGIKWFHKTLISSGVVNEPLADALDRCTRLELEMFEANVRLAISVAEKYGWSWLSQMDRIQEAYLGLLKAIERFDYERGFKFSTYATWWLRQSVSRAISDKDRTIRIPVHMLDRIVKLAKVARTSGADSARSMQVGELAKKTGYSEADVRKALSVGEDATLWEDSAEDIVRVGSFVDSNETPLAYTERTEMERIVRDCIDGLKPREAEVIYHRFGLLETGEKTLEEVGQMFNLTRERIRQIEAKALKKLSNPGNPIAVLAEYVRAYK